MKKLIILVIAISAIISCKPTIEYRDKIVEVEVEVEKIVYVDKLIPYDNPSKEFFANHSARSWKYGNDDKLNCRAGVIFEILDKNNNVIDCTVFICNKITNYDVVVFENNRWYYETYGMYDTGFYNEFENKLNYFEWVNLGKPLDRCVRYSGCTAKDKIEVYDIKSSPTPLPTNFYNDYHDLTVSPRRTYKDMSYTDSNNMFRKEVNYEGRTLVCTNSLIDYLFDNNLVKIRENRGNDGVQFIFEKVKNEDAPIAWEYYKYKLK